jgi:hypothetical protein
MKNILSSFFIISILTFNFIGCKDNSVSPRTNADILYSADEIVCDYNDSTVTHYSDTVYIDYQKTLLVHVWDRSFSKVKISGTVDTFYTHNEMSGQNPILIMGVIYDTIDPYVGDSITEYHRPTGDFLNITPVTYPENEPFLILFTMQVADPARGDFIRVKNLRISKMD